MYSLVWMNQFERKDMCIEFVINNVSLQGNDVKIKLNLKINLQRLLSIFYEINGNAPGFCLVLSEAYS